MAPSPLGLRKNRLQASCDPCRKSKLRCDHDYPCSRCLRRRRECLYSETPTTRHAQTSLTAQLSNSQAPITSSGLLRQAESVEGDDPFLLQTRSSYYARDDLDLGVMGSTSHSVDLLEHQHQIEGTSDSGGSFTPRHSIDCAIDGVPAPALLRVQRLCLAILDCLPTQESALALMDPRLNSRAYVVEEYPTLRSFYGRFFGTHGQALKRPRNRPHLLMVSDVLCRSTTAALRVPRTNQAWLDSVCGFNSRWELVGIVLVEIAACTWEIPDSDPLLKKLLEGVASNKRDYVCRLLDASDACYRLCTSELKQNNRLTIWLFNMSTWLQSVVGGDSSLALWMRKGAAVAATTAFGAHRDLSNEDTLPRAYIQDQRAMFALLFTTDTMLATFTGRPASLSYRHVITPLPWDISAQIALDDSIPLSEKVDSRGWAKDGKMSCPPSRMRAIMIAMLSRQKVLELCFTPADTKRDDDVRHVRQYLEVAYADLPAAFHVATTRASLEALPHRDAAAVLSSRLQFLLSHFILERVEQSNRDHDRIFRVAQEMLVLVTLFYNLRDRLPGHYDEIVWSICCFGIPAASFLSIELWKSSSASAATTTTPLPRSQVILDLSVFLSSLEWIDPAVGNFLLCERAHRMIKGILDRVLSPPTDSNMPSSAGSAPFELQEVPTFGLEFENYFENFDWDAVPWNP